MPASPGRRPLARACRELVCTWHDFTTCWRPFIVARLAFPGHGGHDILFVNRPLCAEVIDVERHIQTCRWANGALNRLAPLHHMFVVVGMLAVLRKSFDARWVAARRTCRLGRLFLFCDSGRGMYNSFLCGRWGGDGRGWALEACTRGS